jgi:hypothetical protein
LIYSLSLSLSLSVYSGRRAAGGQADDGKMVDGGARSGLWAGNHY